MKKQELQQKGILIAACPDQCKQQQAVKYKGFHDVSDAGQIISIVSNKWVRLSPSSSSYNFENE
jgi:hypothetical protein